MASAEGPARRMRIAAPATYAGGWISDKEHLVTYIGAVDNTPTQPDRPADVSSSSDRRSVAVSTQLLQYRVTRKDGARLRSGPSLDSDEVRGSVSVSVRA